LAHMPWRRSPHNASQRLQAAEVEAEAELAAGSGTRPRRRWPPQGLPPAYLLHLAAALVNLSAHAVVTLTQWRGTHSDWGRAQTAALLLAKLAAAGIVVVVPRVYWRNRCGACLLAAVLV
jgi:hypothetical protein